MSWYRRGSILDPESGDVMQPYRGITKQGLINRDFLGGRAFGHSLDESRMNAFEAGGMNPFVSQLHEDRRNKEFNRLFGNFMKQQHLESMFGRVEDLSKVVKSITSFIGSGGFRAAKPSESIFLNREEDYE